MPFFRRALPTAVLMLDALVSQALTALTPQVTALTLHLPQALGETVVTPLLHRLTAFCWDLPASAAHHITAALLGC